MISRYKRGGLGILTVETLFIENKTRLAEWTTWKTVLGLDNMPGFDTRKLQYFNHGSTDSLDVDR